MSDEGLVNVESPEAVSPSPLGRLAGDWSDDDPQAIDQYFEADSHAPMSYESVPYTAQTEPAATRIVSRVVVIGLFDTVNIADPVQLFPIDLNRKQLILQVSGNTVVLGSEKSDCYNGAALIASTNWSADEHTGAIWVYAPTATAPVTVVGWCITE